MLFLMFHYYPSQTRSRGLAPLEMVLAIPFLLGIMALMVCFGQVACWKVRALTVARHSLWGNLSPGLNSPNDFYDRKTGNDDPRPAYWPAQNDNTGAGGGGNAAGNVDDPRAALPVVRGPALMNLTVNSQLLDPARDMRSGTANMTHVFPMLKSLGNFHLNAETWLLDDAWRAAEMGIWNNHFRLALIYPNFQPPTGTNPVIQVMLAIYSTIQQGRLALLYGTEADFIRYQTLYGQAVKGLPQLTIPVYINSILGWTQLSFGCSMDAATIQQAVDDLVERISAKKRTARS